MSSEEIKEFTDLLSTLVAITYQNEQKILSLERLLEKRPKLQAEFQQALAQVRSDNSGKEIVVAFSNLLKK